MRPSIRLNAWYTELARAIRAFRQHVRTARQFWLLIQMLAWSVCLRLLRPLLSVQRLVWLAVPAHSKDDVQPDNVLRYLQWLDAIGVLAKTHKCLVRALVGHRFLTIAGVKSTLLIGFDGEMGHSWVEVDGEAVFETHWAMDRYRAVLATHPGCRKLVRTNVVDKER
jgi:hypothetical protein